MKKEKGRSETQVIGTAYCSVNAVKAHPFSVVCGTQF